MPILLGLALGAVMFTMFWAFIGPFIALGYFIVGQFLLASLIMALSIFCFTLQPHSDLVVTKGIYILLIVLGAILETIKHVIIHCVKNWWTNRTSARTDDVVFNIIENEPAVQERPVINLRRVDRDHWAS
jgi:hypothetical protein